MSIKILAFISLCVCITTVLTESKKKPSITPNLVNGIWSRIGKRNKDFDCNKNILISEIDVESIGKLIECIKLQIIEFNKSRHKVSI